MAAGRLAADGRKMMRQFKATLTTTAALAVLLALTSGNVQAKESGGSEAVPTYSFSGAFLAGRAAEADNDFGSAISYYKRAIAFDPDNVPLQSSLLQALLAEGRIDEAIPYAEKLKSVPEVERFSRLVLAVDAFRNADYKAAENWLELVLESDIDALITGIMTCWAEIGQGDLDAALANLDGMDGPDWYPLFTTYQRALMLAQGQRHDEAVAAFDKVLNEIAPRSVAPYTMGRIAEVYASYLSARGENDKALEVLDKAEAGGGGIAMITVLREKITAGETLEPLIRSPSDGAAEILLNLATELTNAGGDAIVRLYLQLALAMRPQGDAILVQLAHVAERLEESDKAISFYEQIDGGSSWARFASFQIGLNLADMDRQEEAISHLSEVLEADPSDMRAYLALGSVYASQKDYASAAALYDRAVEQIGQPEPHHWNIFYQRGIAYERLKEWEKAEPNFKKALELSPDHPQVLNYLGYSWVDMNINLEEGLDLIRRAVQLRPSDGYVVDSLGWAYYRLGRYEEAVEELERAVSLRPDDAILNDHLGDAYWRVDRKLEARYQWSHVLDMEAEDDVKAEVRRKLEEGLPELPAKKFADAAGTARNVATDGPVEAEKLKAPAEAEKPEASAEPALYTVKPGQTLWSIAAEELGDGERFREILKLNPVLGGNPDRIEVGQEIKLPADGE
ncbi:tetratricopeptide repeat protein [Nitratireductor luteus]|uniref:tetratricopeptide repeat protein n=1 Tax=Nitratireductor luteus TaxID=2976980 RepID=UPI00223F5457|nr:tetratricopeptide repeat protein [Nitratireductor luteus]